MPQELTTQLGRGQVVKRAGVPLQNLTLAEQLKVMGLREGAHEHSQGEAVTLQQGRFEEASQRGST